MAAIFFAFLSFLFQIADGAAGHAPERRATRLSHGCDALTWDEILYLAELHSEGAKRCLQRFAAARPGRDEGLLAQVLLEEWEIDPNVQTDLHSPRPLSNEPDCHLRPEIKAEIGIVKPYMIVFEVWVNRRGHARWGHVFYRISKSPLKSYEQCMIAFALRSKYRPAWNAGRFIAKEYRFGTRWDYF